MHHLAWFASPKFDSSPKYFSFAAGLHWMLEKIVSSPLFPGSAYLAQIDTGM